MTGSDAADLLVRPGKEGTVRSELNTEAFWERKVEDVPVDEVFFHSYFNQAGKKKRKADERKESKIREDDEGSDDEGEEEIWKAITASKPEVEGPDEDDDLSMGDLESDYSASDQESDAGIDLGGDAEEDGLESEDMDGMPELDSGDDAMFDDEDETDMPDGFVQTDEKAELDKSMTENQKKRKERKKLKQLPTFASVDDYARLIGNDDDDDM